MVLFLPAAPCVSLHWSARHASDLCRAAAVRTPARQVCCAADAPLDSCGVCGGLDMCPATVTVHVASPSDRVRVLATAALDAAAVSAGVTAVIGIPPALLAVDTSVRCLLLHRAARCCCDFRAVLLSCAYAA
jgi:hypothetical protein